MLGTDGNVAALGNGSEGHNVVEIESQRRVNVVNKCLHILLGAFIEWNHGCRNAGFPGSIQLWHGCSRRW